MENIYKEIQNHIKQSNIANFIINYDRAISKEDLVNDIFIKVYDKDIKYIHNTIKLALIDIYRMKKISYSEKLDISDRDIESDSFEKPLIELLSLEEIKKQDELIYKCLYYYFVSNMTYKEIEPIVNVSFNTVKRKIDKGLEMLREYYKS